MDGELPGDPLRGPALPPLALFAALGSVGEAAARLVVTDRQRKRPRRPADDLTDEELETREQVFQAELLDDRTLIESAADPDWLRVASLVDLGRAWRAAVVHGAAGFEPGWGVAAAVEECMRDVAPSIMDNYDRQRDAGAGQVQAMRLAVAEAAQLTDRRAELEDALRAETQRLAEHVDRDELRQLRQEWRAAGQISAANAAGVLLATVERRTPGVEEHLAALAERERAEATRLYGQSDLPATLPDERHEGLERGAAKHGQADHDRTAAAAQARRVGGSFPTIRYEPAKAHTPRFWGR